MQALLCPALAEPLESDNQPEGDAQEEDNHLQHAGCPSQWTKNRSFTVALACRTLVWSLKAGHAGADSGSAE